MGTHKLACRSLHDLLIQVFGIEPGPVHIERIPHTGIVDGVGILFPGAGTDCVESIVNFKGLCDHNVHRQMGIECIREPVGRDRGGCTEIGNITLSMDTRIRTATTGNVRLVAYHHRYGSFQGLLDSRQVFLHLPTVVSSTKIG